MKRSLLVSLVLLAGTALSAWAPDIEARHSNRCGNCGTVDDVDRVYVEQDNFGGGTIIGALVGAAVGNQIGSGSGRRAATVAGAVAGGAVGHRVEKNRRGHVHGYRIYVRMDNGRYRTIEQREGPFHRGERVRVSRGHVSPLY